MKEIYSKIAGQIVADYNKEKEWREMKERINKTKKGKMENKIG